MRQASVQLANVHLTLGGVQRLQGVTQTLPAHGITAVVGANGAGKSLLLHVLHGLIPLTQGTIRWSETLKGDRRAFVRQQPQFLRRSALDNLIYALRLQGWTRRDAHARAHETLTWLKLSDQAGSLATRLSPGQQARLAMARALAVEPGVLLLDEPTASLDPEAALALESLLAFARDQGTKVILVSHSLGQVRRLAHDVLMLDAGRVVHFGPQERFFREPQHPKAKTLLTAAGFWPPDQMKQVEL